MQTNRTDDAAALGAPIRGTDGSVTYEARVANTVPMTYLNPDGSMRLECRRDDALHSIVAQLPGTTVTLNHPDGLIKDGADAEVVGTVVSARADRTYDDVLHAVARIRVDDDDANAAIEAGTIGLSLGYRCDATYDENVGLWWQGTPTLDHLAIVPQPRCRTCKLRADAGDHNDCACDECDGDKFDPDLWDPETNTITSSATPSERKTMATNDHNDPSATRAVDPDDVDHRTAPDNTRAGHEAYRETGGWAQPWEQDNERGRTREQAIAAMSRDRDPTAAGQRTAAARLNFPERGDAAEEKAHEVFAGGSVYAQMQAREAAAVSTSGGPSPYNAMPADDREAKAARKLAEQTRDAWRGGGK